MTDIIFFDTDCLSAFLWINDQCLLGKLYSGRIVIPGEVYDELSNPSIRHLKQRLDQLIESGAARIEEIEVDSKEYELYQKLISDPDEGHAIIGRGEASAIVLAWQDDGVLASNNLRDVSVYVEEFQLKHMTTGDILKEALAQGLIDEDEGNVLWAQMLQKRRRLGYDSFSAFLEANNDSIYSVPEDHNYVAEQEWFCLYIAG